MCTKHLIFRKAERDKTVVKFLSLCFYKFKVFYVAQFTCYVHVACYQERDMMDI